MNTDKAMASSTETSKKHTYTFSGINSALDAAQMKRSLERNGNKVEVEIGFNEMFHEGWVRLTWYE